MAKRDASSKVNFQADMSEELIAAANEIYDKAIVKYTNEKDIA